MTLTVSPKRIALALALAALALTLTSFVAQLAYVSVGRGDLTRLLPMLFVGKDDSLPAWYSSVILLLCSVLLAGTARVVRRPDGRGATGWAVLSVIFLYLAVDEGISIHEKLSPLGRVMLRGAGLDSGVVSRAWVVPGAIFALVVALAFLGFLLRLPPRTRNLFVVAGGIFVGAAIGMEVATDAYVYLRGGPPNLTVADNVMRTVILPHIEELLEMLGVTVFVYALLAHAGGLSKRYELSFDG